MTSVSKLRELESNQRPPGSEPGVTTNSNYPASTLFHDTLTIPRFAASCGGRSRTCGHVVQSHVFLPTETTPHHQECPAGVEPASPGWKPGTSAARPRTRVIQ